MCKHELKRWSATVALSGTVMWVVAGIWHNYIMARFYALTHASHDGIFILLLAYWILAALMLWLFTRVYEGENALLTGMKVGIFMGFTWVVPHGLAMAGAHGEPILYVFKNGLWHIVEEGIGGTVMALLYTRLKIS